MFVSPSLSIYHHDIYITLSFVTIIGLSKGLENAFWYCWRSILFPRLGARVAFASVCFRSLIQVPLVTVSIYRIHIYCVQNNYWKLSYCFLFYFFFFNHVILIIMTFDKKYSKLIENLWPTPHLRTKQNRKRIYETR